MNVPTPPHPAPATKVPRFHQKIGPFDGIMLVVGTIIGSGIFIVAADISCDVGTAGWLLAAWVLTGVMTLLGALSYAELAAMMPHAGGQYVFLRESYSPLWGFLYGWACFLVIQTGSIAAVGVAFAKYLGVLAPRLGVDDKAGAQILFQHIYATPLTFSFRLPWMDESLTFFERDAFTITAGHAVAVGIIMFLSLVNCLGVREGKWVQNIFTVAKVLGLLTLIVVGLTVAANAQAIKANTSDLFAGIVHTEQFSRVSQIAGGTALVALMVLGGAMVGSLFSADAWNNLTFIGTEVKDPRRNLPLCLSVGVMIVITLYLLANLAYVAALPVQGVKDGATTFERGIQYAKDDRVATAVFETVSPTLGVTFISLAVMISTFGSINGMILMGARLYYAMARDGLFFQSVGNLNGRGVPAAGLILQGIWSALLVFSGTYSDLLDYVIFAALLFYVLTVAGLFILRFRRPDWERPYRVFGYPLLPLFYILLCAAIMIDLLLVKPVYTWPGLIIVLSGIPVYFVWRLTVRPMPSQN